MSNFANFKNVGTNVLASVGRILDGLLGWFGASGKIKTMMGKDYSEIDFEHDLGKLLAEAKNKGEAMINKIQNKLDSLPMLPSPSQRNLVSNAKKQLRLQLDKAKKNYAKAEAKETEARGKISEYNQDTSYLSSIVNPKDKAGKKLAQEAIDEYSSIVQGVDQPVN